MEMVVYTYINMVVIVFHLSFTYFALETNSLPGNDIKNGLKF
jgi:hypothetical protein